MKSEMKLIYKYLEAHIHIHKEYNSKKNLNSATLGKKKSFNFIQIA